MGIEIIIGVTKGSIAGSTGYVHHISHRHVGTTNSEGHLEIQRHISTLDVVIVHQKDGPRNILKSDFQIIALPRPPNTVEIGMVYLYGQFSAISWRIPDI